MNRSVPQVRAGAHPAGVFDTLQAGFNLISRHAWLLILPACLELFIWLGPQLVFGPLLDRLLFDATALPGLDSGLSRSMEEARRSSAQLLRESDALARFNVLSVLSLPQRLLTPAFSAFEPPRVAEGPAVVLPSLGMAALSALVALGVGLVVAAIYYGLLAEAVRGGTARLGALREGFGVVLLRLSGLVLILFAAIVGVVLPVEALLSVFARTSPMAASVVGPVILGVSAWLFVYLFFTVPAMFVSRVGPIEGARHSMRVVRRNLWSSTGLIVLTIVISAGLSVIWSEMADLSSTRPELAPFLRRAAVGVAISAHIYITGGLLAACMTYYKERHEGSSAQPSLVQPVAGA